VPSTPALRSGHNSGQRSPARRTCNVERGDAQWEVGVHPAVWMDPDHLAAHGTWLPRTVLTKHVLIRADAPFSGAMPELSHQSGLLLTAPHLQGRRRLSGDVRGPLVPRLPRGGTHVVPQTLPRCPIGAPPPMGPRAPREPVRECGRVLQDAYGRVDADKVQDPVGSASPVCGVDRRITPPGGVSAHRRIPLYGCRGWCAGPPAAP
jgi:hypothetical protein